MQTRKLLSQTAIYMVGLGLSRGMGLLLVPLYTRQLTEAGFFTWDICTTSVLFALAVAELGMSSALARFYVHADTDDERRAVAQTSAALALVSVAAFTVVALAFQDRLAVLVLGNLDQPGLVGLITLTVALTAAGNLPLALLRAQERAVAFATLCFTRAAVGPACIIVLVVKFDYGVRGILIGDAIGLGVQAVFGLAMCRSQLLPALHKRAARMLLAFGIPLVPIGIANTIVIASDRYFLREFVDPTEAATFSLGFKIATIVSLVTMALQTAWAPAAFRIAKLDDARRILADTFRILAVGLGLLALATSACAPELARIFAPAGSYEGAHRIVPWIAFSYALQTVVFIVATNLVIVNRIGHTAFVYCSGAVLKLALSFVLIKSWGIAGAAAATLLTYVLELLLAYLFVQRLYPLPYNLLKLVWLAALLLAAVVTVTWLGSYPTAASLAARALTVMIFLVALLGFRILPPKTVQRILGTLPRTLATKRE